MLAKVSMKNIRELSIEEIISMTGLAVKINEYALVVRNDQEVMDRIRRIVRRLEKDASYTKEDMQKAIIEVLKEYESRVDKERLVMLTAYNLKTRVEDKMKTLSDDRKKKVRSDIANAVELLSSTNAKIIVPQYILGTKLIGQLVVLDSKELVQAIKSNRPLKSLGTTSRKDRDRYNEAISKIGNFGEIANLIDFDDIEQIIAGDREIGEGITNQIANNVHRTFQADHMERDILLEMQEDADAIEEEFKKDGYKTAETIRALEANCRFINMDNLFLLIGYRIIQELENDRVIIQKQEEELNARRTNRKSNASFSINY